MSVTLLCTIFYVYIWTCLSEINLYISTTTHTLQFDVACIMSIFCTLLIYLSKLATLVNFSILIMFETKSLTCIEDLMGVSVYVSVMLQ